MSIASERRSIVDLLPAYALLSIPQLAAVLGCGEDVAREMVDAKVIPSIRIGARRMVDPMDAAVYVLAEREGVSVEDFWDAHGDAAVDLAKKYFARVRRFVA